MSDILELERICLQFAHRKQIKKDPAHDINHVKRVLQLAKSIHQNEGGNLKVIIPSALFHDIVLIPKENPKSDLSTEKSGQVAFRFLTNNCSHLMSSEEIAQTQKAITLCSFSKNLPKDCLESKILQDSDGLEAVGSIAIMRSFTSGGLMNRPFYHLEDPFCENRQPEPKVYTLDLFYHRLFKIKERLFTETAKSLCTQREKILHDFIAQLKNEI